MKHVFLSLGVFVMLFAPYVEAGPSHHTKKDGLTKRNPCSQLKGKARKACYKKRNQRPLTYCDKRHNKRHKKSRRAHCFCNSYFNTKWRVACHKQVNRAHRKDCAKKHQKKRARALCFCGGFAKKASRKKCYAAVKR